MTAPFTKAAVLEILNSPQSWDTFPDMIRRVEALEGCAQCCMCGKTGLSTAEDGGPECELHDGRWVCSSDCWDRAALEPVAQPETPEIIERLAALRETFCYASPGSDEEFSSLLLGFDTAVKIISEKPKED